MIFNIIKIFFFNLKFKLGIVNKDELDNTIYELVKSQGIVFTKIAQILTSRTDTSKLLGEYLHNKLASLQDQCNQENYENINHINYINLKPIASGSICQIFLIRHNNKISILKTLVPNIHEQIELGRTNFNFIKNILYYTNYNLYKIINLINIDDLNTTILDHTFLDKEAENTKKFKEIFHETNKIIIPEIFYEDEDKIIMSYEKGIKLNELKENKKLYKEALFLIFSFFYISIKNNILHGDFHHSNFYFINDNNELKMIVLDFGIICKIEDEDKKLLMNLFNTEVTGQERNKLYVDILNKYDIYPKNGGDLLTQKVSINNLFDEIDITKVPIKYISLSITLPYYKTLVKQCGNMKSFLIKLFAYMYKNKFLEYE